MKMLVFQVYLILPIKIAVSKKMAYFRIKKTLGTTKNFVALKESVNTASPSSQWRTGAAKKVVKIQDLFSAPGPDLILRLRVYLYLKNKLLWSRAYGKKEDNHWRLDSQDLKREEALRKKGVQAVPLGPRDQRGRYPHDHPAETRTDVLKTCQLLVEKGWTYWQYMAFMYWLTNKQLLHVLAASMSSMIDIQSLPDKHGLTFGPGTPGSPCTDKTSGVRGPISGLNQTQTRSRCWGRVLTAGHRLMCTWRANMTSKTKEICSAAPPAPTAGKHIPFYYFPFLLF